MGEECTSIAVRTYAAPRAAVAPLIRSSSSQPTFAADAVPLRLDRRGGGCAPSGRALSRQPRDARIHRPAGPGCPKEWATVDTVAAHLPEGHVVFWRALLTSACSGRPLSSRSLPCPAAQALSTPRDDQAAAGQGPRRTGLRPDVAATDAQAVQRTGAESVDCEMRSW
jgi:hypothetical protein